MPIKPENRDRYPANWDQVRAAALDRAMYRCQECGEADGAYGYRKPCGEFVGVVSTVAVSGAVAKCLEAFSTGRRLFRIVLTVHHWDEQPENNAEENLVALCQRCHLAKHRGRPQLDTPELFDREG